MSEKERVISLEKEDNKFEIEKPFNRACLGESGVWVLLGKKSNSTYVCLNVGKTVDIGREILYDVSCLKYVKEPNDASRNYINQFGEDCGFNWKNNETQECLYPYIAKNFSNLTFVVAFESTDKDEKKDVEKGIADRYKALFWRNGKAFEKSKDKLDLSKRRSFENLDEFCDDLKEYFRSRKKQ
ncbi:MAG: hypothetical protein J5625_04195 [Lachnospiraceae bacterium]|nr:hypothetical protein [Lachnospiraceae bacterium]